MSQCGQELCGYWTGDGCACRVLGLDPPGSQDEYPPYFEPAFESD